MTFILSRSLFLGLVSALLAFLSGCVTRKVIVGEGTPPPLYEAKPVQILHGKASFYAGSNIGRLTATGEIYKRTDVTAAHKTLPFGTMVRATNLRNGKSVIVRINDRGPYIRGRIIDLSLVAAQQVDMISAGVVPIRVEVLKPIPVVQKSNLKLTAKARKRAEAHLAEIKLRKTKKKAR